MTKLSPHHTTGVTPITSEHGGFLTLSVLAVAISKSCYLFDISVIKLLFLANLIMKI